VDVILAHDPLCGWCFGSIVETNRLVDLLERRGITFDVRCGGLVTGERVRAIHHDAEYLRTGLEQVRRTTGQRAGYRFLEGLLPQGTFVSDSEPLCQLLWCVRDLGPKIVLGLGHSLSSAFYRLGLPPTDFDVIIDCLQGLGLDANPVLDHWETRIAREGTAAWMAEARSIGVTTYPSVLVRATSLSAADANHMATYECISAGFESADVVFDRLRLFLAMD
jgi:putative protein-disulfide isomerase